MSRRTSQHRHVEILDVLEEQSRPAFVTGLTNVRGDLVFDVHRFPGSKQFPFCSRSARKSLKSLKAIFDLRFALSHWPHLQKIYLMERCTSDCKTLWIHDAERMRDERATQETEVLTLNMATIYYPYFGKLLDGSYRADDLKLTWHYVTPPDKLFGR